MDDRESGAGVDDALAATEGVEIRKARLTLGDYLVNDRLLFERKSLPDLAASLVDGRLLAQACRLVSAAYRSIYTLEGSLADLRGSGVRREAIQGAIVTLTVILGLPVLRSADSSDTARLICYTARQCRRHASGGIHRPGYRPRGKRKRQLYVLQGLPGIGPGRAERLLDTFGSLEAIFMADVDDLAEVDGLGYTTAERIRSVVKEPGPTYGVA